MNDSPVKSASFRLFALLAMVTAPILPPAASAAILSVGSTPDCTHASLRDAALASQAGDTIHLVSGAQTSTQVILDNSDLAIIGGFSSCIAATPDVGAFSMLSPSAALNQPFVFIFGGSNIELENVAISGAHTDSTLGGAIRISEDARLAVANVRVHDNSAKSGAGILVAGNLDVLAGTNPGLLVENNTAMRGGGLYIEATGIVSAALTAELVVRSNNASTSGGGVYLQRFGKLVATLATISGNTATVSGGGIHVDAGSEFSAATPELPNVELGESVTLDSNSSTGEGGGLYAGPTPAYHVAFAGVASNNSADRGGAMALTGSGRLHVSGAEISMNSALTLGGGLSIQSGARLELGATRIHHNSADRGGGLALSAGTLTALPGGAGVLIHDNSATDGAGIAIEQTASASFDGDCSSNCLVSNNIASGRGGGLYSEASPLLLGRGWIIDGNQATDGGGIALRDGRFESADAGASDSLVISNNLATSGGGIHVESADIVLRSTRIAGNHASTTGGGMHAIVSGQEITLANSRLVDNVAANNGGAMYAATIGNSALNLHVAGVSGLETQPVSGAVCNGESLPANEYCSVWKGNRSANHTCGEVLYLSGQNTRLTWEATALLDSPTLAAALCLDVADLHIRNSLIAANGSSVIFLQGNGSRASEVTLESVSAINNSGSVLDRNASWIGNLDIRGFIGRGNAATLGSTFAPTGTFFECNFTDDGALAGDTRDPMFESTWRGDWRLRANSPARSSCPIFNHFVDQDGFERPLKAFDAGAFAWYPTSDRIFGNGFD